MTLLAEEWLECAVTYSAQTVRTPPDTLRIGTIRNSTKHILHSITEL